METKSNTQHIIVYIEIGSDNSYSAYIDPEAPVLPFGLIGEGRSISETIEDFLESREEMKDYYKETGKEFPEVCFTFKPDVKSFTRYFSEKLALENLSINQQTPVQQAISKVGEEMFVYHTKHTDERVGVQAAFHHLEKELAKAVYNHPEEKNS